jgi:hypothetical protein
MVGKPKGKGHLEDPGLDGRVVLKGILKKLVRRVWT